MQEQIWCSGCLANTFPLRNQLRLQLPWSFHILAPAPFFLKLNSLVTDLLPQAKFLISFLLYLCEILFQALKHKSLVDWQNISSCLLAWLALLLCSMFSLETEDLLLAEVKIICFDNVKLGIGLSSTIDWLCP